LRILITGALGNIGRHTVRACVAQHHLVRAFDLRTPGNERLARSLQPLAEIVWGDLRHEEDIHAAITDQEVVIHLAGIIPPQSELNPELAQQINVSATQNLLFAIQQQSPTPRLLFSSSCAVFGATQSLQPPRRVSDPMQETDHYSSHKIACERLIQESDIPAVIFRLAAAPAILDMAQSIGNTAGLKYLFERPLADRIEFVHPEDVALAFANAVARNDLTGKILLIGGGANCQVHYADICHSLMAVMGVGDLPSAAFTKQQSNTDWIDTAESQALLQYQRHSLADYTKENAQRLQWLRMIVRLLRPLIRQNILAHSSYYQASRQH
jgi:UDP-glucose 4-epimerase